jgi:hypothetical protein
MTIVNAKWLVERNGKLSMTVPQRIETLGDELAAALS